MNVGCKFCSGDFLIFISGHCIPVNKYWLQELCNPLINSELDYVYGKQQGRDTTKFSEELLFEKFYPNYPKILKKIFSAIMQILLSNVQCGKNLSSMKT